MVNTKRFVIKVLSATDAASRLQRQVSAESVWAISSWQLLYPISGILRGSQAVWVLILDISPRTLEKVLYFASYVVLDPGSTSLQYKQVLSEKEYREEVEKYGGTGGFRVGMGAESIQELLKAIDLEKDSADLRKQLADATGQKRARIIKRLEVVEAFLGSGNRPEWMIMDVTPGYSAGHPSYGAVRRRTFCHL